MSTLSEKIQQAVTYLSYYFKSINEYTPELMKSNPYRIQELISPSKELQMAAIQTDPSVIQYIQKPSEKIQLLAVVNNPSVIRYIQNPSEKVQLVAVQNNPSAIQFIKDPQEKVLYAAMERNAQVIQHIPTPSEEMQFMAIKRNAENIQFINKPTLNVQLKVIHSSTDTKLIEKVEINMIKDNPGAITLFPNPSEAVQLAAVKADPFVISKINNPSEAVQLAAVKADPFVISRISNPYESTQILAMETIPERISINNGTIIQTGQSGNVIMNIKNPSEAVQLIAIKRNASNIDSITNPSEAVQLAAIYKKKTSFLSILNPTEKVQCKAFKSNPEYFIHTQNPTPLSSQAAVESLLNIKINTTVDNDFIVKVQSLFSQIEEVNNKYDQLWLQADYADDRKQAWQEMDEAASWKDTETNKIFQSFKEEVLKDYPYSENDLSSTNNTPKTQEVQTSGSKTLLADVSSQSGKEQYTNLRITDKSTGKTEPLNVADIDLSKQNPEAVKNLLSGKQVEITNKSGAVQMMGLSKTATGWGITAAKQIFSTADSSAGI